MQRGERPTEAAGEPGCDVGAGKERAPREYVKDARGAEVAKRNRHRQQAALGAGVIGYWIGFQRGRRSTRAA